MSPEKRRSAIAEACGWKIHPKDRFVVIPPNSPHSVQPLHTVPDYLNDLNATHEAFKRLGRHWEISQVHDGYYCRIQFGPQGKDIVVAGLELSTVMTEAFLRALNKWEGGDHE